MNPKYNVLHSLQLFSPTNWLLLIIQTCLHYAIELSFLLPGVNPLTLVVNCSQHCDFYTGDMEQANAGIADGWPCYRGKVCIWTGAAFEHFNQHELVLNSSFTCLCVETS